MRPERAAGAVSRWVALYTAGLPASVAHRRRKELDADLADHIDHARADGVPDARIARQLLSRMLRGAAADVSWRSHERRTHATREGSVTSTNRSVLRVGIFVLAVLAIPFTATIVSDEAGWGVFDFVLAGVLLAVIGACFEAALRRRGSLVIGVAVAVLGIAAAAVGEVDDAPGLILLGGLMVAGGGAIAVRRVQLR